MRRQGVNHFIPTVPYSGRVTGHVSLFFAVGDFGIRLKRNFLCTKKSIFPSFCVEKPTVYKYWKAFCIRVFNVKKKKIYI